MGGIQKYSDVKNAGEKRRPKKIRPKTKRKSNVYAVTIIWGYNTYFDNSEVPFPCISQRISHKIAPKSRAGYRYVNNTTHTIPPCYGNNTSLLWKQ